MGYEFFEEKIIFPSAPVPGINNDQSLTRNKVNLETSEYMLSSSTEKAGDPKKLFCNWNFWWTKRLSTYCSEIQRRQLWELIVSTQVFLEFFRGLQRN